MEIKQLQAVQKELDDLAKEIVSAKREAYTSGSKDQLANFKRISERMGLAPLEVWGVYMNKQVDSINSFIKDGSESEPIATRFADTLNYLYFFKCFFIGWVHY